MGDAACHLSGTCLSCGRFLEADPLTSGACPHCGGATDGAQPAGPPVEVESVNTILYCRDWPAAVAFYRQSLGLEVVFSNGWFVEFGLREGVGLSVADAARTSIPPGRGRGLTVSIRVADLRALREVLADRGVSPSPIGRRFGSEVFDVHDPEGHRIEFWADQAREPAEGE